MPFDDGNGMPGGTYEDYDYSSGGGGGYEEPAFDNEEPMEEEVEEKPSSQDIFFEKLLSRIDGLESRLSSAMTHQQTARQPQQEQAVDEETGYAHSRASAEYKQVFDELIEEAGGPDYVTDEVKKKCHAKALRAGQKEERLARAEYRSAKMEELSNPHYETMKAFENASPVIKKYLSDPSTSRLAKEIMNNVFDVAGRNNATSATAPVRHRTQGKAYISPRSVRNTQVSADDEQDQSQDLSAYFKSWGMKQPAPRRRR